MKAAPRSLSPEDLRQICLDAGADDVGFVEAGRAALAADLPDILRVLPSTKTLISVAGSLNRDAVRSTAVNIVDDEFRMSLGGLAEVSRSIVRHLNHSGVGAVSVPYAFPSDMNRWPGKIWDVSHKLVAREAGLGAFGLSRILLHPVFGSFISLSTILIDAELDAWSRPVQEDPCIRCRLCVSSCPVGAIREDGRFDFLSCFTHSYRDMLAGFQDWIERIISAKDVRGYRSQIRDKETLSMWQSLTVGFGYKCSNCVAVCPAGMQNAERYRNNKQEFVRDIVGPLLNKAEPVYVLSGTRAELVAKQKGGKEVRCVRTPIRPTSVSSFLLGVKLAFNPEKAGDRTICIHFRFYGDEPVSATIKIDKGEVSVDEGIRGEAGLRVHADAASWVRFLNGEISLFSMLLSRRLRLQGNPLLLKRFKDCLLI